MQTKFLSVIGCALLSMAVLSGCGQAGSNNTSAGNAPTNPATSTANSGATSSKSLPSGAVKQGSTMIVGAKQYQGQANEKKYEAAAKKNTKSVQAQIDAAKSAYVNGDAATAITYYKKAIAISPKSGQALTNLGNIYLRTKNDPKTAKTYYLKATKGDPSYGFGWYNLAVTQAKLGNVSAAKTTLTTALKSVKSSDKAYSMIKSEQKLMTSGKKS